MVSINNDNNGEPSSPSFVALIHENGISVDVMDVKGKLIQYSIREEDLLALKGGNHRHPKVVRLCFSSHGMGDVVDELLTPCFDENGEHGEPEESCWCGEDDPHIHAHIHDPSICNDTSSSCSKNITTKSIDLSFLAKVTLYPVEKAYDEYDDEEDITTKTISDPCCHGKKSGAKNSLENHNNNNNNNNNNETSCAGESCCSTTTVTTSHGGSCCNEESLVNDENIPLLQSKNTSCCAKNEYETFTSDHLIHEKLPLIHMPVNDSLPNECNAKALHHKFSQYSSNSSSSEPKTTLKRKRIMRVKHDNHFDYLVHNSSTGNLHLEHPCNACGIPDHHGQLQLVTKRYLQNNNNEGDERTLHFFEVVKEPLQLLDVFKDLFDIHATERVALIRDMHYCCFKAAINKPCACPTTSPPETKACSKTAEDEESTSCCAGGVCTAQLATVDYIETESPVNYNKNNHNHSHDHDHDNHHHQLHIHDHDHDDDDDDEQKNDTIGRSQFFVQKICCSSEVGQIRRILEPMQGVSKISVNVTSKTLYVDHETKVLSAEAIAQKLNVEKFGAQIKRDAGKLFQIQSFAPKAIFVLSKLKLQGRFEEDLSALNEYSSDHLRIEYFDPSSQVLEVEHNPYFMSLTMIRQTLKEESISSQILMDGAADGKWALSLFPDDDENHDKTEPHSSNISPFVLLSGFFWILSMLSYSGGNWNFLKFAGLLSVIFGLPPISVKAIATLKRFQFDTNCMMMFAILGAVGLQEFPEAAAVTFLFSISEFLESRATRRARDALSAIVNLRPEKANLVNPITNEVIVIPASSVAVGTTISVKAGDKIPCDGVVLEGSSTVDESSLTGESRPIKKKPTDKVSGGTINSGSTQLVVKATATVDNSAVGRLIRLVEEAQANRSPTEQIVDDFARLYTPFVVFASMCMCTIPWAFGPEKGKEWTYTGLILIVIACPCALIISTPVTYVAGLAATAQKGVIIKGGAYLEALGNVKTIAFDKTGTLTEGCFKLIDLRVVADRISRQELLEYLALIEERATHPLAAAILKAAKNEGVSSVRHLKLENHTFLAGEGVSAQVNGVDVHVGNAQLVKRLGLYDGLPEIEKQQALTWASESGTVGFVSIEGRGIVGSYCVSDSVRRESYDVIQSLLELGIDCHMLTGDGNIAAESIGRKVGLSPDNIKSQLKPEDKLRLVTAMKNESDLTSLNRHFGSMRKHKVLMCGDGINDAPALAAAHIGVSMGEGAALAMETSDVTLMDSNLNKLLFSIKIGSRVTNTIIQNITFSIVVKAIVMGFTIAGRSSLWAAIVSDVGAMIIVTLNGMKLLPSNESVQKMKQQGDFDSFTKNGEYV